MNSHKNARTTYEGRKLLIARIADVGLSAAAESAGISLRTARKWRKRFEAMGLEGLADLSSRPRRTRTSLDSELVERIEGYAGLACPCVRLVESSAAALPPSAAPSRRSACRA